MTDLTEAADVEAIAPGDWVIHVGCKGVLCGACSTVLIAKPKDRPLVTATHLVSRAVADHLPTCRAEAT